MSQASASTAIRCSKVTSSESTRDTLQHGSDTNAWDDDHHRRGWRSPHAYSRTDRPCGWRFVVAIRGSSS
ncbi:hypothetical protein CLV35_0215 [Motilibacter peucedani]|uniref:Uncharacterized protein n=1 Tax=Motilibacter peucedani TaxID=598650 RepID=A0A420XUW9_9ACTN|nr:hypothetical protein CLV35_0215 [Motilibacter peucedani]